MLRCKGGFVSSTSFWPGLASPQGSPLPNQLPVKAHPPTQPMNRRCHGPSLVDIRRWNPGLFRGQISAINMPFTHPDTNRHTHAQLHATYAHLDRVRRAWGRNHFTRSGQLTSCPSHSEGRKKSYHLVVLSRGSSILNCMNPSIHAHWHLVRGCVRQDEPARL